MKPPVELVRAWFAYDPETGLLSRLRKQRSNIPNVLNANRMRVDFLGVRYQVTHIIWVVHYGKWPDEFIDHIDHNRRNNRIVNLREATRAENGWNRIENNPNGKGVTFRSDKREGKQWQAQIQVNNQKMNLGFFATKELASEAFAQAATQYHGEFACLI
jgi:hypothetical protein